MLVTLLTDFGAADYFVGAMKGAVLSANPRAQIVDITHEIPPHDVWAGAFTLAAAFETFPEGTVHAAVVDPGVGSARRPVVVEGAGHFFVGPDNGLFGHVYERLGEFRVFHVTDRGFFRAAVSATFHGRDVFAPVAGALSRGVKPETLGEPLTDFVRLAASRPRRLPDGTLEASVIHVDRFGNCVTSVTPRDLADEEIEAGVRIIVGGYALPTFRRFFAETNGVPLYVGSDASLRPRRDAAPGGETAQPFAIWGSAGFLEVAVYLDSAARVLGVQRGAPVRVQPRSAIPHNG
jgi:S-adenosylmethionine hydrolase